jgi:hypothetical protein
VKYIYIYFKAIANRGFQPVAFRAFLFSAEIRKRLEVTEGDDEKKNSDPIRHQQQ